MGVSNWSLCRHIDLFGVAAGWLCAAVAVFLRGMGLSLDGDYLLECCGNELACNALRCVLPFPFCCCCCFLRLVTSPRFFATMLWLPVEAPSAFPVPPLASPYVNLWRRSIRPLVRLACPPGAF